MLRQRFSCEALPLHVFKPKFWRWLEDLAVARPFLLEEGDTEVVVVGPFAYNLLVLSVDTPDLGIEIDNTESVPVMSVRGMSVRSNVYQKHDSKDSFDIRPFDIEYRVIQP